LLPFFATSFLWLYPGNTKLSIDSINIPDMPFTHIKDLGDITITFAVFGKADYAFSDLVLFIRRKRNDIGFEFVIHRFIASYKSCFGKV